MKKAFLSLAIAIMGTTALYAVDETLNPLITAMPSLSIAPDARSAGMGDLGVATTADMNSQYWNAAKFAFHESHGGIVANYTPWLRKLVSDIDLAHLEGFYKWDDLQGIGLSFTYFSMGDVTLTTTSDPEGKQGIQCRPYELSVDASYYRKLHEYVSMGVVLRFMYSDLNNGINTTGESTDMHPAWTMAADIDIYYKQPIGIKMGESYFSLGFCLQNLGGKMSYKDMTKNFIPANMRIGIGYELPFDNYNKLTFNIQADKLMVPSRLSKFTTKETAAFPDKWNDDGTPKDASDSRTWQMSQEAYSNMSSVDGIFKSFCDAPGGAAEEFKEVRWGAGLEYTYNRQFFARLGYSYENYYKGNRNYVTVGAGFHLSIVMLDVSYCIGLSSSNPLDQTMRFTLGFDLAGIKDLANNKK